MSEPNLLLQLHQAWQGAQLENRGGLEIVKIRVHPHLWEGLVSSDFQGWTSVVGAELRARRTCFLGIPLEEDADVPDGSIHFEYRPRGTS